MTRLIKWFCMLTKRLYKKASFLIILALIPLCVFMFSSVAQKEKGFLHVILVQTDPDDTISSEIIDDLISNSSVIRFSLTNSVENATEDVKEGEADEAWIFPKNMEKKISNYVEYGTDKFISIIAREKTVFSMLSREKLSSAVFEYTAKVQYLDFARTEVEGLDHLSDEDLMHYFDTVSFDEELFVFGNSSDSSEGSSLNYLTSPIRGFLGILIMICGMAAALYLMQDEKSGTFSWASDSVKLPIGFASMFIAVLNVSAATVISLVVSNLSGNTGREILLALLYCVNCTAFCLMLKLIISNIKLYATIIPLISLIAIAVCPVFFNLNLSVSLILPPTYYINGIYNDKYILYMALYTLACLVMCWLLYMLRKLRLRNHR